MALFWKRFTDSDEEQRETMAVAAWMKELASRPSHEAPLPDPTYLWWKAEMLRRWDAQQKASEPIEVAEQVQVGVGLAAAVGLLIWLWRTMPGIATSATASIAAMSLTLSLTSGAILLAAAAAVMVRDLIRGR